MGEGPGPYVGNPGLSCQGPDCRVPACAPRSRPLPRPPTGAGRTPGGWPGRRRRVRMSRTAQPPSCPSGLGCPLRPYRVGGCAGQGWARDRWGVAVVWKPGPEPTFPHPGDFRRPSCLRILPLNHLPQRGSWDPGRPGATRIRPAGGRD